MASILVRRAFHGARVSSYRPGVELLETRTAPGDLLGGILGDPLGSSRPSDANLHVSMPPARTSGLLDPCDDLVGESALEVENQQRKDSEFRPGLDAQNPPKIPSGHPMGNGILTKPTKPGGSDQLDAPGDLSGGIVGSSDGYVDILISWTYNDVGAKLFQIDRSTSMENHVPVGKVDYLDDVEVDHYQFLDPHLPAGPTYHYWVKAVNGFNQSPWSEVFIVPTA